MPKDARRSPGPGIGRHNCSSRFSRRPIIRCWPHCGRSISGHDAAGSLELAPAVAARIGGGSRRGCRKFARPGGGKLESHGGGQPVVGGRSTGRVAVASRGIARPRASGRALMPCAGGGVFEIGPRRPLFRRRRFAAHPSPQLLGLQSHFQRLPLRAQQVGAQLPQSQFPGVEVVAPPAQPGTLARSFSDIARR